MKTRNGWGSIWLLSLLLLCADPVAAQVVPDKSDLRVLIDISGSMKKNDPDNLRRSALRLLVGLLPDGTRAGVWTFGQYVNMEIPLGRVDKAWKQRARTGAGKIHSRGMYTNIEGVLKRASEDWEGPRGRYHRDLLLLTDGMVDISKDRAKNAASRSRILDQLVPRLKALDVRVHAVALSERADHGLLREITESTGGWYEQIDSAERLQRVFMRIFEKVGRPDTLPLKDNRFTVDKSVKEVTLLVFRAQGAAPTRLQPPGEESFGKADAPESVTWHDDEGYDLLTIKQPAPGEWRVQAQMDPDNRVMVVTDLKMKVTDLPNRLVLGQKFPLLVSFTNKGGHINRKTFLQLLQVRSSHIVGAESSELQPLVDDGSGADQSADDGYFTQTIGDGFAEGRTELVVNVEGRTFQREQRQLFDIVSPLVLEVGTEPGTSIAGISITPRVEVVDSASLRLRATLKGSDDNTKPIELRQGDDHVWHASLDLAEFEGSHQLQVVGSGTTSEGRKLDIRLGPRSIEGQAPASPQVSVPERNSPLDEAEANAGLDTSESEAEAAAGSWLSTGMILGAVNLGLILLGGVGYWVIRRKNRPDEFQLLEPEEAPA